MGISRPRKLTPLANRPAVLDLAAQAKDTGMALGSGVTRQALHMPVKYSGRGSQQTSRRPSLDPIVVAEMTSKLSSLVGAETSPRTTATDGSGSVAEKKSSARKYVVELAPMSTPTTAAESPTSISADGSD